MKLYFTRYILIARLAALALVALCSLQAPVGAQGMTGVIVIFPSVGLAPGESIRLTLFNPDGEPVRAQAQIRHPGGGLFLFADGSVRAGAFHSFDFSRSDIPLAGEESTGRIQLSASFEIRIAEPRKKLAVSMETISISDGTSHTVFVGEIPPSRGGEESISLPEDVIVDFGRDQRVRVTLTNPPPYGSGAGSEARRKHVRARVKFFDESGNLIAQSDELVIPPGEFRSADLNRDALPSPGEPRTGRLQVRAHLEATTDAPSSVPTDPRATGLLAASLEIIDNSTGKTTVLTGQQRLVFFLGGIPND